MKTNHQIMEPTNTKGPRWTSPGEKTLDKNDLKHKDCHEWEALVG